MIDNPYIHIITPVIFAIITNGLVFLRRREIVKETVKETSKYIPPGYIVGSVWIILFGLLGYAHYLLYKLDNGISIASMSLILFIIFSLAYPFLTKGFIENVNLLNVISLILAFILSLIIIIRSQYIFLYMIPLLLWVSYVNVVSIL